MFWLTPGVLLRSPAFRSLVRSPRGLKKERSRLLRRLFHVRPRTHCAGDTWKHSKCFPSTLHQRNLTAQKSLVNCHFCLRKTLAGKSRDYRDVIVFEKLRFQNVFHPFLPWVPEVFLPRFPAGVGPYYDLKRSISVRRARKKKNIW